MRSPNTAELRALLAILILALSACTTPTNLQKSNDPSCPHDQVQQYIYDTYEIYKMYWPYAEKFANSPNPIQELVQNGDWYLDIFHDATKASEALSPPPCAADVHTHFINGWASLVLAGFQADVGNPDLALKSIRDAADHFDQWNSWINNLR